ncbi:small heat shock protein, chloroplastic-like [Malania oleifera]|uniref:small heat shock protein, chloroplastic-like n=1 Tax=Malania oleifera TaxID=397392 RepID=UPI0025ADABA8|nr:small heat shock protein, chloroplastic-like [Malania oleifera]
MASSLYNINVCSPFSSQRLTTKFPSMLRTERAYRNSIKAMAEGKDNLNHLRKATQKQTQLKEKSAKSAPVGIWDRFPTARTVQQMMDTMERMIEDPFAYSSSWPSVSTRERNIYSKGRTPWEIKEGEQHYKMRFDMPGMTKNDVKLWVEDAMLIVKAGKDGEDNGEDKEEWPARSFGKYSSKIALPENVKFENISAEVKDGVLYITIPKTRTTSKIIDISVQ